MKLPFDTSPEAAAVQQEIITRMTPAQRLRLASEMSESMRNLALAGVRHRHPDWSEEQCKRELLRLMYGFERQP